MLIYVSRNAWIAVSVPTTCQNAGINKRFPTQRTLSSFILFALVLRWIHRFGTIGQLILILSL